MAGVIVTIALLAAIGLFIVYTGSYNVAATDEHTSLVRWAFHTTLHESVERRSASISQPATFTPEMVAAGAPEYRAMCQHCHAGPGVERSNWASGMLPKPPHLTEGAEHWNSRDVFWLVKHGVKMSGMPAFGPTHDDHVLWNIAAFVKELPAMTPEDYASLTRGENHHSGAGAQHGHGGSEDNHRTGTSEDAAQNNLKKIQ